VIAGVGIDQIGVASPRLGEEGRRVLPVEPDVVAVLVLADDLVVVRGIGQGDGVAAALAVIEIVAGGNRVLLILGQIVVIDGVGGAGEQR
jgi:hypothetical protein